MIMESKDFFSIKQFESAISKAEKSYHKLLLLVGKSGTGKTATMRRISGEMQIPIINLGLVLSRRLLSLTARQRKLKVADMIADIMDEQDVSRLGVDNTEVIFEPSLKLNTLGLLKNISKSRTLIWSWNGEADGDNLVYAYPGHPEHQRIFFKEFTIITV